MNKQRREELLAYASVCFEHATSPFETMHLVKKGVTSDECMDLTSEIGDILLCEVSSESILKATKEFMETQQ